MIEYFFILIPACTTAHFLYRIVTALDEHLVSLRRLRVARMMEII